MIVADTIIQANALATSDVRAVLTRGLVWVSPSTGYCVYLNSATSDLRYMKTTDSGATWTAADVEVTADSVRKVDVWFDKWAPGDSGVLKHMAWLEITGTDAIHYRNLNTSTDALSTDKVIQSTSISTSSSRLSSLITLTKAKGNNLYIAAWENNAGGHSFWRSTDGGVNWTEKATHADGDAIDYVQLFPGNETDTNDIYMVYLDLSATELSLKTYDDTGNSWSEQPKKCPIANSGKRSGRC